MRIFTCATCVHDACVNVCQMNINLIMYAQNQNISKDINGARLEAQAFDL